MNNPHIKIWTRYTVPKEYEFMLSVMDDDDGEGNTIENTSAVIHLPAAMLEDEMFKEITECENMDKKDTSPLLKWMGDGCHYRIFLSNAVSIKEHPDGDGYLIACGSI